MGTKVLINPENCPVGTAFRSERGRYYRVRGWDGDSAILEVFGDLESLLSGQSGQVTKVGPEYLNVPVEIIEPEEEAAASSEPASEPEPTVEEEISPPAPEEAPEPEEATPVTETVSQEESPAEPEAVELADFGPLLPPYRSDNLETIKARVYHDLSHHGGGPIQVVLERCRSFVGGDDEESQLRRLKSALSGLRNDGYPIRMEGDEVIIDYAPAAARASEHDTLTGFLTEEVFDRLFSELPLPLKAKAIGAVLYDMMLVRGD